MAYFYTEGMQPGGRLVCLTSQTYTLSMPNSNGNGGNGKNNKNGSQSRGKENNSGNYTNDRQRASEDGRKGGER